MEDSWEQQKEKGTLSRQQTYQITRKCIFLAATTSRLTNKRWNTLHKATAALYFEALSKLDNFTRKQPLKYPAKANIFNKPTNTSSLKLHKVLGCNSGGLSSSGCNTRYSRGMKA
ncbi:hypothetical protein BC941DRAFT_450602 [Chlamydoabsidia padenii]|nr:hypothetical protein BC941DRAFT_450602 [Chlamydoabsidia padenii]